MSWFGRQLRSAVNSKPGIRLRRRYGLGPAVVANHEIDGITVPADVVVYFSDLTNKAYQLEQWLPSLEKLHETRPVLLVFRKVQTLRYFRRRTRLPKIFVRRLDDLVNLYTSNNFKLCLYVNNGVQNFQSLSVPGPVHVHINHGESDKLSMVSNQAKAYDRVLVAGPAAVERHRQVLRDFDLGRLITVGRPQLDADFKPLLPPYPGRTILYAPTWEGENEANNYTSLDTVGESVIRHLVTKPGIRIIYKPHPRVLGSNTAGVAQAHARIVEALGADNPWGITHVVAEEQNILDLFEDADALITDISSVGLDFLYLHPDKPLVVTDRREDLDTLHREAPISRCCPVVYAQNVGAVLENLFTQQAAVANAERLAMRAFYFGDDARGESTARFISTIDSLIVERHHRSATHDLGPEDSAEAG